jgi:hypothetical protein
VKCRVTSGAAIAAIVFFSRLRMLKSAAEVHRPIM